MSDKHEPPDQEPPQPEPGEPTPRQEPLFDPRDCDPMDLIEHLGDEIPPEHLWTQLLADVFQVLDAYNRRSGMEDEAAAIDARNRVILLAEYFGGRMVYLPKGERLKTATLHALMWKQFRGSNHRELAQRYDLNEVTVYEILAKQRALFQRRLQGRLFNE